MLTLLRSARERTRTAAEMVAARGPRTGSWRWLPDARVWLPAVAAVFLLAHPTGSAAPTVEFVAKEFAWIPAATLAHTGDVTFVVDNQGVLEHNLIIEPLGGPKIAQIAIIEPGETRHVDAYLRAGTYKVYCGLPGHKEAGMVATLRVEP